MARLCAWGPGMAAWQHVVEVQVEKAAAPVHQIILRGCDTESVVSSHAALHQGCRQHATKTTCQTRSSRLGIRQTEVQAVEPRALLAY